MIVIRNSRTRLSLLLLALLLGFGSSAIGGPSELPRIDKNGRCPEEQSSDRKGTFREYRARLRRGGSVPRQVIVRRAPLHADNELIDPMPGLELVFQQEVRVLRWNQGRFRNHLVKYTAGHGARCGWIENGALLPVDRNEPLPISRLRADGVKGFTGRGSTLDAKVLVKNHFDTDDLAMESAAGARIYYHYTDSQPYSTLKIFNVLNVFDHVEYRGERWFFVGGERATESHGVKPFLHGWVQADEVIPWSTLVNVYYRTGKGDIYIYENNDEAENGGSWFAHKGDEPEPEPKERNFPRFPLLDTAGSGDVAVHRIAFPGSACDSQGNCVSAQRNALDRGELGEEVRTVNDIDFLFVIDATESMSKYFKPVVQGILGFLREAEAGEGSKVRFSIVVYGDFLHSDAAQPGFQFARVVPFGSANNKEQLKYLLRSNSFTDNMKDLPEAGFAALAKAIGEAAWREQAGWRMVIWIGDHPNRSGALTGKRSPVFTEQDVATALKGLVKPGKGKRSDVFTAINVRGNYIADHNDLFIRQAERILALSGGFGLPPRRAYEAGAMADMPELVGKLVKENLFEILAAGKQVPELLLRLGTGEELPELPPSNLPGAVLAHRYVKERLSMDDADIQAFFKRSQLVREGWVRQDPQDPDFDYWVSVKPPEMGDMVEKSEDLCETLSNEPPDFNRIKDAMVATLRSVTGDVPRYQGEEDEDKIRYFLSKSLHVPLEQFSVLLSKNIDDFISWYENSDQAETRGFKEGVCKKSALLKLAYNAKRVDGGARDIVYDKRLRAWRPKDGRTRNFNWVWGTEHGINYYYIPLEYVL